MLRFGPTSRRCEIVADGFRNPYDMDFNLDGELFTYDSDNERCVWLPWYEPTRFYHVVAGRPSRLAQPAAGEFWRCRRTSSTWRARSATSAAARRPACVCYRHAVSREVPRRLLPARLDVRRDPLRLRLKPAMDELRGDAGGVSAGDGDNGFAPTAAVVHPADRRPVRLHRRTGHARGGVYRIRVRERTEDGEQEPGRQRPRFAERRRIAAVSECRKASSGVRRTSNGSRRLLPERGGPEYDQSIRGVTDSDFDTTARIWQRMDPTCPTTAVRVRRTANAPIHPPRSSHGDLSDRRTWNAISSGYHPRIEKA